MAVPGLSVETKIPFQFLSDGTVAMETDQVAQITQHVKSLVATDPGERAVISDYGTGIGSQVFEPDAPVIAARLANDISQAMVTWEAGVSLAGVTPVPTPDGSGIADVQITFIRTDDSGATALSSTVNRAIIRPGGEVIEVVQG